jgi:hypothetical protein
MMLIKRYAAACSGPVTIHTPDHRSVEPNLM